ncbi:MAG: hypothetical protein FJ100_06160 [Deltaproteobacteria bacterium]|nr:hypothetical protein [Deltaproteobacteria bacterium]
MSETQQDVDDQGRAAPDGVWPAERAVDDWLAQLAELRAAGADDPALVDAMVREGLSAQVAGAVLAAAQLAPVEAAPASGTQFGVEMSELRRPLRLALIGRNARAVVGGPEERAISDALRIRGVAVAQANLAARELAEQVAVERAVKLAKLRRLGVQAAAAGAAFAAFFVVAGAQPHPGARWHWVTAGFSLAMALWGAAVYRRARAA